MDPTAKVKPIKETSGRIRWLTPEEEARLRAAVLPTAWPVIEFAFQIGLRRGEQSGLQWGHVDMRNGVLTIPRSKNGEKRHVPINSRVLQVLRSLPTFLKSRWVFASATGEIKKDANNFVNRYFRPALEQAKICDFHWHDLRHTTASRLVMKGVDICAVQEIMGLKDITMTRRYAHFAPSHVASAMGKLVSAELTAEQPPEQPPAKKAKRRTR